MRRLVLFVGSVSALAIAAACVINTQPLPPEVDLGAPVERPSAPEATSGDDVDTLDAAADAVGNGPLDSSDGDGGDGDASDSGDASNADAG